MPVQFIDAIGNKLAFLENMPNTRNKFLTEIDMKTGEKMKSVKIPEPFYNNILAINTTEYLYAYSSSHSYIFSMDGIFRKIEIPNNVLTDSMYKVKNRIFTMGFTIYGNNSFTTDIYEFKDYSFKKFIALDNIYEINLLESDDEYMYLCAALDNYKTFKFYRLNTDGSNLTDLGISLTGFDNYRLNNPKCFKIGDYIYGLKEYGRFFRVNIKTKSFELKNYTGRLIDLQYSPLTKELYALNHSWDSQNKSLNSIFLVNQQDFTLSLIQEVNGTRNIYVETEKIEHEEFKITASEPKNNSPWIEAFPNPVIDFVTIRKQKPTDKILVYDLLGREMLISQTNLSSDTHKLDFTPLPSGIYFIRASTKGQAYKIVKQ